MLLLERATQHNPPPTGIRRQVSALPPPFPNEAAIFLKPAFVLARRLPSGGDGGDRDDEPGCPKYSDVSARCAASSQSASAAAQLWLFSADLPRRRHCEGEPDDNSNAGL